MAIQISWTEADMRARAILGVPWLQKHYPEQFRKIDLEVLSMDDGDECALGLCHGEGEGTYTAYLTAMDAHCLISREALEFGFTLPYHDSDFQLHGGRWEVAQLWNAVWMDVIRDARAEPTAH